MPPLWREPPRLRYRIAECARRVAAGTEMTFKAVSDRASLQFRLGLDAERPLYNLLFARWARRQQSYRGAEKALRIPPIASGRRIRPRSSRKKA
jgi:hypothetical protein